MIRVGLAHTQASYDGVEPPYHAGAHYPELAAARFLPRDGDAAFNPIYGAVRAALASLGLDARRFGGAQWNPLGDLVSPGGRVVLKPNFIRDWNARPGFREEIESVVTHGSLLRAVADYAFLAVGPRGSVTIAEAPQQDCDFARIEAFVGLPALLDHYAARDLELGVIDLRREGVRMEGGVIAERFALPGDPAGYRSVDLGETSFFTGSGLDPNRFRGADYDPGPTAEHHIGGRNEYLLSETVLSSDLVVSLPKLKTHKKTGVTLALKNLVGINGDKNWLPHHSVGSVADGGDEFLSPGAIDRLRSALVEATRPMLAAGRGLRFFQTIRKLETAARGDDFLRAGNWYGNRTTWRMCCDLNRCLYYSDREGLHLSAPSPVRKVLTVLDGIVAGEGSGPLSPVRTPLGVVLAGVDPVAVDLAAIRLIGFDERRIPKVWEAMHDTGPRITAVRGPGDVVVGEATRIEETGFRRRDRTLDEIGCRKVFLAHPGWVGHIEGAGA